MQAHVVNSLDVLKLQPQPVEDCLEKLGYLLAGGDATPAVVGVHAHELAKAKKEGNGLEVCNVFSWSRKCWWKRFVFPCFAKSQARRRSSVRAGCVRPHEDSVGKTMSFRETAMNVEPHTH